MKKTRNIISLIAISITLCMTIVSCDIETSDNGNFDGFWQLTQIDTIANNKSVSMKESQIFWAVQTDVLEVRNISNGDSKILFRFNKTSNQLTIHTPYYEKDKDHREILEDEKVLKPYCIQGLEETFTVEKLTNSDMQLSGTLLRLHFRKY